MESQSEQAADDILEVPEGTGCPAAGTNSFVVNFCDFLLTCVFQRGRGLLHAQRAFGSANATWYIQEPTALGWGEDIAVAVHPAAYLRMCLARFGSRYMAGQLYGGYSRRLVRQGGRHYLLQIYMSNQASSDFWIRVYAALTAPIGR